MPAWQQVREEAQLPVRGQGLVLAWAPALLQVPAQARVPTPVLVRLVLFPL